MANRTQAAFATVVGILRIPVFLADTNTTGTRLTLHVCANRNTAGLREHAEFAMREAGSPVTVTVRSHKLHDLAFPKSLARWLAHFQLGTVIYDPTGIVTRARAMVQAAGETRTTYGDRIAGLHFDPARRELFVLNRRHGAALGPAAIAQIRASIDRAWGSSPTERSPIVVKLAEHLPARALIAVDESFMSPLRRIADSFRRRLAPGAVALSIAAIALPAWAKINTAPQPASTPAVENTVTASPFGILTGLSVFVDGMARDGLDSFTASGLKHYFGPTGQDGFVKLAQIRWRWRDFDFNDGGADGPGAPGRGGGGGY